MQQTTKRPKRRPVRWCRTAMRIEPRRSAGWRWGLLILVLLALFGVLAARTEGARQLIENRLQRSAGLTANILTARIGWPYDLVLTDVDFFENDGSTNQAVGTPPVLRMQELRFGWRPRRGITITVRDAEINLWLTTDGQLHPVSWAALRDVEDAAAVAAWLEDLVGQATAVDVKRGTIRRHDLAARDVDVAAENLRLVSLPLRIPDRSWRYYELTADRVRRADGTLLTGLQHEWLMSRETSLIQLGYDVAAEKMPADAAGRIP